MAHEWLDDVPCPVVERADDLAWRVVEVDPWSGRERLAGPVARREREWLERWWPSADPRPGDRAEVGTTRDDAWAALVRDAPDAVLLAVDYGHDRAARPPLGSLTGYRDGTVCSPVADGSCDVTAHVAVDALAAAGERAGATRSHVTTQREALQGLGVDGSLPSSAVAAGDPIGYLRAVSAASQAGELLDRAGLGAFRWVLQSTAPDRPDPRDLLHVT